MAKAVDLTFGADFSQAKRETDDVTRRLEKQEQVIKALQRELRGMGRRLEETQKGAQGSAQSMDHAFGSAALSKIKSYVTSLIGVGGLLAAYRMITAELERHRELQSTQVSAQTALAQAHQDVIRTMPGAQPEKIAEVLSALRQLAGKQNVPEATLGQAMAQALSSTGGNVPLSLSAVSQAAKFLADRPEQIARFAGSLLDIAAVTGTPDAEINQGFLGFVGGLSRVVDAQQQAKNIPGSLVGATGFGATPNQAGALFAALSNAAKDVEGALTGTGLIKFSKQLKEFMPAAPDMGARISALQADPALAAKFLKTATFDVKTEAPLRQLLTTPGSEIATAYSAALGAIPGQEGLRQVARQQIANRQLSPYERVAERGRAYGETADELILSDIESGLGAASRQSAERMLAAAENARLARTSGLDRFIRGASDVGHHWVTKWILSAFYTDSEMTDLLMRNAKSAMEDYGGRPVMGGGAGGGDAVHQLLRDIAGNMHETATNTRGPLETAPYGGAANSSPAHGE